MADKELRAHLRVTGENAAKAGLKGFGDEAAKAGDKVHDLGDETGFLGKQVEATEVKVKELIKTLNETGDVTLLKEIRKGKRELKLFDGLKKELEAELKGAAVEVATPAAASSGGIIGEGLAKGIGAAIAAGGPYVMGGLAAVAAAITPFIGGVVAAAVLGGVGAGGIAGGIALAAQDRSVRAAAEEFGRNIGPAFVVAGEPFTKPVIEALHMLQGEAGGVAVDLRSAFSSLAPELVPFTAGLTGLVKEALPGFINGMEASKPVLRVIANELPPIGRALGDFVETVGEESDGAVLAWQAFSRVLQGTIRGTGQLIANLSEMFEWSVRATAATSGAMEDVLGWVPIVGDMFESTNNRAEAMLGVLEEMKRSTGSLASSTSAVTLHTYGLGIAAGAATEELEAQRVAMQSIVDLELGMIGGTVAVERAIDSFSEAVKENGKSLDITEEAGRRNTETLAAGVQQVLDSAQREHDLAIAHGATALEAENAAKVYRDKYGKALEEAALKAYGNSAAIQAILDKLHQLDGKSFSYTLIQRGGVTIGAKVQGGFIPSGFEERASGGPTRAGRTYLVGEHGPELWSENRDGHITNASATAAMMSGTSGGTAQPVVNITFAPSGNPLAQAVLQMVWPELARQIRVDGGVIGQFRIPRG